MELAVIVTLTGIVFMVLGYPLWTRRIRPNGFYGFRTQRTRASERVWYEVNRVTGLELMGLGLLLVLLAGVLMVLDLEERRAEAVFLGVMLAGLAALAVHGERLSRRLSK